MQMENGCERSRESRLGMCQGSGAWKQSRKGTGCGQEMVETPDLGLSSVRPVCGPRRPCSVSQSVLGLRAPARPLRSVSVLGIPTALQSRAGWPGTSPRPQQLALAKPFGHAWTRSWAVISPRGALAARAAWHRTAMAQGAALTARPSSARCPWGGGLSV